MLENANCCRSLWTIPLPLVLRMKGPPWFDNIMNHSQKTRSPIFSIFYGRDYQLWFVLIIPANHMLNWVARNPFSAPQPRRQISETARNHHNHHSKHHRALSEIQDPHPSALWIIPLETYHRKKKLPHIWQIEAQNDRPNVVTGDAMGIRNDSRAVCRSFDFPIFGSHLCSRPE